MTTAAEYQRAYRERHPERARETDRRSRINNSDARRATQLRIKFGITPQQYDVLLQGQGGTCAMCPATSLTSGKRLAVDHDHATGTVRGLLCDLCNRALGLLNDDVDRLLAGVAYLGKS